MNLGDVLLNEVLFLLEGVKFSYKISKTAQDQKNSEEVLENILPDDPGGEAADDSANKTG